MGRLDLNIEDELERKFRDTVYQRKGMKKGNLTEALEEALEQWINNPVTRELEKVRGEG